MWAPSAALHSSAFGEDWGISEGREGMSGMSELIDVVIGNSVDVESGDER